VGNEGRSEADWGPSSLTSEIRFPVRGEGPARDSVRMRPRPVCISNWGRTFRLRAETGLHARDSSPPQAFEPHWAQLGVAHRVPDILNLFRTMQAYGGTYTFHGNSIEHHIDISFNELWTGTTVIRDIRRDGDRLIYTTKPAPFPKDGKMSVNTLVWEKVK
jgi:hypothetical protein